jgi:hypothetical protein
MSVTHDVGIRPTLPMTRAVLVVFSLLTALAVLVLYLLPDRTDRLFAWTISPPLTAAFLGAGYAAGCVLEVLSLRERAWARNRVPVLTILVFTGLTLVATLLHLDRFHFTDAGGVATFAAWLWTAVYVAVPLLLVVVVARQERVDGEDPPRNRPVPTVLRGVLGGQSAVMLGVGAALFLAPATSERLWPWTLTPLTARTVAAWLLALGMATALAAWGGDLDRLRTATVSYTVFGAAVLVALLRFRDTVAWDRPVAWLLTALAASILLTGAAGWAGSRTAGPPGRPGHAA